ncbi:unnamed protein product [Symbiodinium natans]|uniref:Uncharacterized protein n=1 Tax=Symbiodinium natans TaxID=878477 RepID=A0A812TXX8_9DINO|nr:unnamed protein product [Symbiodinium natans]
MGATQCGFCCLGRDKGPDGQQPLGLPDLLTKRRSETSQGSPEEKVEKSKEVCGNGSEGSEPQPASQQEMKKDDISKKATAAEEREAFLQALMRDRAEADRAEVEAQKEAKRAAILRRLEATNRGIRAQFEKIASAADFKEAKVQFVPAVEEIPMEAPLAPCAPASSDSSATGVVKKLPQKPILKGAGERKHLAPCRGQVRGDESPTNSSDDSVYPDYDGDDDGVCFEE